MTVWDQVPAKVDEVEAYIKEVEKKVEKVAADIRQDIQMFRNEFSAFKNDIFSSHQATHQLADRAMARMDEHEEKIKLLTRAVRKED